MKKATQAPPDDQMEEEYDFTGGIRGKYADRYAAGSNVVLAPDVAAVFPDSAAVNEALRLLAKIARQTRASHSERTPINGD
ncbi:MAG TPA: hypothetical protein VM536_03020 [Chloroflexia bacterium]|nr:hypothetical protein [Chloroflexia bacterium]